MGRRSAVFVAVIALVMGLAVVPGSTAEAPNELETDTVVSANLSGGCFGRHQGSGNNIDIVVAADVVATGSTSISVTCHVWQGARTSTNYEHGHVGAFSAVSAAAGGGLVTGFNLAPYTICAEIHASFPAAPPYNKECPTH